MVKATAQPIPLIQETEGVSTLPHLTREDVHPCRRPFTIPELKPLTKPYNPFKPNPYNHPFKPRHFLSGGKFLSCIFKRRNKGAVLKKAANTRSLHISLYQRVPVCKNDHDASVHCEKTLSTSLTKTAFYPGVQDAHMNVSASG